MNDPVEFPVAKRRRRDGAAQVAHAHSPRSSSRLFAPFRTLGLVSPTHVPFTSVPLGKTTFQLTTSVGNTLHTYDLRRGLNLVFLSRPLTPRPITATCAHRDGVFAAWGGLLPGDPRGLWLLRRGRLATQVEIEGTHPQELRQILVFGSWIVAAGLEAIEVWKADSYEHYTTIVPSAALVASISTPAGTTSARRVLTGHVCTIPTFLNKIVAGRRDGVVEIYNVSTGQLVHSILPPDAASGEVTALMPAPTPGLLAIAYANGSVVIVDVEADGRLLVLHQRSQKLPVTTMSFRTDGLGAGTDGRQDGVMATASGGSGDITLWDLNRGGKVAAVLRAAHDTSPSGQRTGVTKIEFLPGQATLVSSGLDNSLRSWVFDQEPFSPTPRLLHSRSGHAAPVSRLKFLPAASDGSDAAGKWLLSASADRSLWALSLRKDGQSAELSQGAVKHKARKSGLLSDPTARVEDFKAAPIIDLACALNRDGGMGSATGPVWSNTQTQKAEDTSATGWESIVTAHADDRFARTWSWGRRKAGRWTFETGDRTAVTSVAMTACGTFAVVGSAGGSLDTFNLQSGAHRRRYPPRPTPRQAQQLKQQAGDPGASNALARGHTNAITGIVVDNLNHTMVSTGLDDRVVFWDFSTGKVIDTRVFPAAPTALRYNPVSGLLAIPSDDLCIRVLDIETRKTVRELWGCLGQIYDLCFSPDGRWIVACSMDSVVRVFDLATGHLIDAFRTATCTNVAFSSTGEFLATTHAGSPGVNIWTNKALFGHVATKQIDPEAGVIDLQDSFVSGSSQLETGELDLDAGEAPVPAVESDPAVDQLDQSLLTLSLVPPAQWQTLLNLDVVRQRNKPIQPPEKPKAAPFFLGSELAPRDQANGSLISNEKPATVDTMEKSRISRLASLGSGNDLSQMSTILDGFESDATHDPSPLVRHLESMPPSAADLEIRSLTLAEMPVFVRALTQQLRSRRCFELVNTWMSVFLKLHGDFVSQVAALCDAVRAYQETMVSEEQRLSQLVGYTKGVVEFLRSSR